MAYINFSYLYENNLTDKDFMALQKIRQKENRFVDDEDILKMQQLGYVDAGGKITKEGIYVLGKIETPELTVDIEELAERLLTLYSQFTTRIGARSQVERNLKWFVASTGFGIQYILETVEEYLSSTEAQYIKTLERMIWEKPNAYATNRVLADSYLYFLMLKKYGIDKRVFKKINTDAKLKYLLAVTKLEPVRIKDYAFTSYEDDVKHIKELKKELRNLIQGG